jgi:hypothetical protein
MMARGAQILRSWAPRQLADELPSDLQPPAAPADGAAKTEPAPTYNQRQNDALQRLIDATTKK